VDFEELYREVILEHARRPRNFGELPEATCHIHGDNPTCGDEVTLHVKFGENQDISEVTFTGSGCSICMASASIMTQKIKRRTRAEAADLWKRFHDLLQLDAEPTELDDTLGELQALQGVRKFPMRIKCATLPWHALEQALKEET
jgi:nitrogen fixation protein NifU and related proteins